MVVWLQVPAWHVKSLSFALSKGLAGIDAQEVDVAAL